VSGQPLPTEKILALLAEAPERIAAVTAGVPPARLQRSPGLEAWSANDVLAHLRSCADMWGGSIAAILAADRPTLRAVNPRTWIKQTNYPVLPFRRSLRAYSAQRAELLALLKPLPPEAWSRAATVTGAGRVLERSVQFYAEWLATHERAHVKQIARLAQTPHS
jgi:hypothetical protein